jgi:membrane protein YdbS with pleckstrin-like domain
MAEWLRQGVLRLARVPPAPEPPLGAPDSIRIFRAGKNYYRLRLLRWVLTQAGAVVGILVSLSFLGWFKHEIAITRMDSGTVTAAAPVAPLPIPVLEISSGASSTKVKARRAGGLTRQDLKAIAQHTPWWAIPVIEVFEFGGILLFLAQLPVTFIAQRLEYELHWYIVTDRSLRIRTGLLRLQETTMSFANLQQVEVQQGPLQRLLGIADLRVQSAGGSDQRSQPHHRDSLHTGVFHSVENASEIRDLILDRLRKFRETGLGDSDAQPPHHAAPVVAALPAGDALAAARELLVEARELRAVLSR